MRTFEYMLANWENIEPEVSHKLPGEKLFRAVTVCLRDHPPIRYINGEACAVCRHMKNEKRNRIKTKITIKPDFDEKERIEFLIKEREKALEIENKCSKLEEIKTGILFLVKGRCAA